MTDRRADQAKQLGEILGQRSSTWFPEFVTDAVDVTCVGSSRRVFSTLHEYELKSPRCIRSCYIKITHLEHELPPYIVSEDDSHQIKQFLPCCEPIGLEYASLKSIENHFDRFGDERFRTVKARGQILGDRAFIMDKINATSFSKRLRKESFGRHQKGIAVNVCKTAGAWLYQFHNMVAPPHTLEKHSGLATSALEIDSLVGYLKTNDPTNMRFAEIISRVFAGLDSSDVLLGVNHHDFAPRNILIHPDRSISLIDTLAEQRRPIFEDLAHFLVDLRLGKLQILSRGLAYSENALAQFETALLEGYFQKSTIPWHLIRAYEIHALLSHWAVAIWERQWLSVLPAWKKYLSRLRLKTIRRRLNQLCTEWTRDNSKKRMASPGPMPDVDRITHQIELRSGRYFGNSNNESVDVQLQGVDHNKFSTIIRYEVMVADIAHRLVVKSARNPFYEITDDRPIEDRPRLTIPVPPEQQIVMESKSMKLVHDYFSKLNHPKFKAIQVYDLLQEESALVLQHISWPTLDQLISGDRQSQNRFDKDLGNTGGWLKAFHGMAPEHAVSRDDSAAAFEDNCDRYFNFLTRHLRIPHWCETIKRRLSQLISMGVLENMELGTSHGDFASHNVFVSQESEVIIFDTLSRWQKPIYEDLAHFLCVLETMQPAISYERKERIRRQLFIGYFGERDVPVEKIQLFQILTFLDKWSSHVASQTRATGVARVAKKARLLVRNRKTRQRIERILSSLEKEVGDSSRLSVDGRQVSEGIL